MFEIKNNKVFMDAVHGYINVPKCFINNLVDTEYFQRLRNIDQTGMLFQMVQIIILTMWMDR